MGLWILNSFSDTEGQHSQEGEWPHDCLSLCSVCGESPDDLQVGVVRIGVKQDRVQIFSDERRGCT